MSTYDKNEELEFLSRYDRTRHERPLASVDVVLFTVTEGRLKVFLMLRGEQPQKGKWALPGVVVRTDDSDLDSTAVRAIRERTGFDENHIEQLKTYGNSLRDARGWSLSVAYYGLVSPVHEQSLSLRGVESTAWVDIDELSGLDIAFDHENIIGDAIERLRSKVGYSLVAMNLLPDEFTLGELQAIHEKILGVELDKSSFRKRIEKATDIEPIEGRMRLGSNRPAQLFRKKPDSSSTVFKRALS